MKMLQKNIKWLLLGLLFIIGLLIQDLIGRKQRENFPLIKKSDEIIGKVSDFKSVKGGYNITLEKVKIGIVSSKNYQYELENIQNHIFIGDSIVKKSDSDTIRIISGNKEYIFVHGNVMNENLRWKSH